MVKVYWFGPSSSRGSELPCLVIESWYFPLSPLLWLAGVISQQFARQRGREKRDTLPTCAVEGVGRLRRRCCRLRAGINQLHRFPRGGEQIARAADG